METITTNGLTAELEERERAIALLSFLPESKSMTIYCQRTGVAIASMQLLQQAGKLPYLSNWKDSQAFHPLFSLPQPQLLAWTRKNWNFLFRNTVDRATDLQKQQFQIAFMAILHTLNCVDQKNPALPSFETVQVNMQRLLELAYWYNYLDSRRFKFPTLRISKLNDNLQLDDIRTYFDICDSVRHDWETSKDARQEDAKLEAARRAEKAVAGSHVKAVSKKQLWNWFLASLQANNSKKYNHPEWMEWKEDAAKLWFSSENQQLTFSPDDVDTIEEVFITECTLGTTVSHAFTRELSRIRENIVNHQKIFEIDWVSTIQANTGNVTRVDQQGNKVAGTSIEDTPPDNPGEAPTISQFNNRVDWIRAKAKYDIRVMQYNAWMEKYGKKDILDNGVEGEQS